MRRICPRKYKTITSSAWNREAPKIVNKKIAVIGAGAMGSALAAGFIEGGVVTPDRLSVSDQRPDVVAKLAERLGVRQGDNCSAVEWAELVVAAVKPAQLPSLLDEIAPLLTEGKLVLSVAAGVTCAQIEVHLPPGVPVVRVMPNVPALIRQGATAIALGSQAGAQEQQLAEQLFGAVGRVVTLPETALDAVTGLSGSGPAYVAVIIEALADGGVRMGLPRSVALELAVQTVLGTAQMIRERGIHPAVLKDQVSSPGGTTIAGLQQLERGGLRGILIDAVEVATRKSQELQSK